MAASSPNGAVPIFPEIKPLGLEDRDILRKILWDYQPETSELTFTNLFMWQAHYGYRWSLHQERLLLLSNTGDDWWALPPLGPSPRREICRDLLTWLGEEKGQAAPRIERADQRLISELAGAHEFAVEPVRDHFDYVYRAEDLIQLAGGPYHAKRNHINSFVREYAYSYEPLRAEHLPACLEMAERWCQWRKCDEDLSLMGEWGALARGLRHFAALEVQGGVILVGGQVEAFTFGELLNPATAVIHIEKANPEMRGLYAVINQQFCQYAWAQVPNINREQDLGEPGLRVAKLSYHPQRLVEKYRLRLI
jgi:uncharacterized protein